MAAEQGRHGGIRTAYDTHKEVGALQDQLAVACSDEANSLIQSGVCMESVLRAACGWGRRLVARRQVPPLRPRQYEAGRLLTHCITEVAENLHQRHKLMKDSQGKYCE